MPLDSRLRFENLISGSANRLAIAAARAVSDSLGAVYNPLLVYGESGLGKTHLACSIGNAVATRRRDARIEHMTCDDLFAGLHGATARGELEQYRDRLGAAELLLIEDVQFLSGRRETQTELLRILNAVQAAGTQVVLTSDRPPSEIDDLDERLLTRVVGGLMVDVGRPDYETRVAILRARCHERGVAFRAGVIEELSRLEFKNVRELQGALNRLIAVQTLGGEPISPSDVLAVLGDLAESKAIVQRPSIDSGEFQSFLDDVASAVAQHVDAWQPAGARTPPGAAVAVLPVHHPSVMFTRGGFDLGVSNQLAVRAADAIVAQPAARYNPLFIHGPSGVGKTHLMHAIGNGLAMSGEPGGVTCVAAQVFVDELIAALQNGTLEAWRDSYRNAAALLLDDIHCIAGKERTQDELFHLFNALHGAHRQLVFVSDRPPAELTGLEDRLRSRFGGGLVVEIRAPDRALRERLFGRLLRTARHESDADVIAYLADKPAASVREIVGMVNRIVAAAELAGLPTTLAFVREALDDGARQSRPILASRIFDRADSIFLDQEKVVWEWPDAAGRLIEELR